MSGLRILSTPCQDMIGKAKPDMAPATKGILGDLMANVFVSALSTPLHQLYQASVTTWAADGAPKGSFATKSIDFLKKQYLTPAGRLSSVAVRDTILRVSYNASIFTIYGQIERGLVKSWPETLTW